MICWVVRSAIARGGSAGRAGAVDGHGGHERQRGRELVQGDDGAARAGGNGHGPSAAALAAHAKAPAVDVAPGERRAVGRAAPGRDEIGVLAGGELSDAQAAAAEQAQDGTGLRGAQRVVGPGGAGRVPAVTGSERLRGCPVRA
jgi:hypothetical protein